LIVCVVVGWATLSLVASRGNAQEPASEPAGTNAQPQPGAANGAPIKGKVVATMNSGGYTYVEVDDGSKRTWAAAPAFKVAVGDAVIVPPGMPMEHFESKTLGRTFDVVMFVSSVRVLSGTGAADQPVAAHAGAAGGTSPHGTTGGAMNPHGTGGATTAVATGIDLSGIRKVDGGQTVAELFAGKDSLAGKDVAVRGKVVKFTANVMGKNWLHLQDGSGGAGTNDLTVSTNDTTTVGSTVVVRGKLAADRDLGFGYHYEVMVENASVTPE
jgi:hypothetical protein